MRLSVLDLVPVRTDQNTGDALAATVRLAQTADRLGFTRYWLAEHHNMPAVAATARRCSSVSGRADHGAAAGVRWGDAAQPRTAGGRRAVRPAGGAAPGAHRPGPGPGPGHRPGHLDPAARHPRRLRRGELPAIPRRGGRADERTRGPHPHPRPGLRPQGDAPARSASRGSGCSARRCTRRTWRPPRACRMCSPTTSPVRARPRRWAVYRSGVPAVGGGRRAGDVHDGQRCRRADPHGSRGATAAESADDGAAAHRPAAGCAGPRRGRRHAHPAVAGRGHRRGRPVSVRSSGPRPRRPSRCARSPGSSTSTR